MLPVRDRGTSGLSGLSLVGRPGLACGAPESLVAGPGWLGASGADAHGGLRRGSKEGGGGPNGPERPADTGRCRAGPIE